MWSITRQCSALRAEHHDLRVFVDFHVVPGRPVEKITRAHRLPDAVRVGGREPAAQHVFPVRALAQVTVEALEKRRGVDARREREVLAADLAQPGRVSEIPAQADHRPRNVHADFHVLFRDSHIGFSRL